MASITDMPSGRPMPRRTSIEAWRRRSRVVRALRVILPILICLILIGLAGSVIWNTMKARPASLGSNNDPIRLVNPRFVGRDTRSRAFVLTAVTATRDLKDYQKVYLDQPSLILDGEGPDPLRITARSGVFQEDSGKLQVSGGVRLAGKNGVFDTAQSLFDTKTGELAGGAPVHGLGALGEINAKSYGVYDQGDRMVFSGGVHTRLQSK